MAKDGEQQSLSSQGHAAQLHFLLWGDSHDGCEMKQVAFGRDKRFASRIDRAQRQGGKRRANQVTGGFHDQLEQVRLVPFAHECGADTEFIVNPIVDVSFGPFGEADFAPVVRLARNLGEDRFVGLEYYSDFGKIGNVLPLQQQYQELYAVTDFKVKEVDVELGVGYGFTSGSDRLMFKAIIGYAFRFRQKQR